MTRFLSLQQWFHSLLSFPLPGWSDRGKEADQAWFYRLRWARPQARPAYICDLNPTLSIDQRFSLAETVVSHWQSLDLLPSDPLLRLVQAHTHLHVLPAGQILLTPDAIALAAWLNWFISIDRYDQMKSCPAMPPASVTLPPTALATRLHLSPWMAIHYIHSRCHSLSKGLVDSGLNPPPSILADVSYRPEDSMPTTEVGQRVLQGIINLVDHLVDPEVGGDGGAARFKLASDLAERVDRWLSQVTIASPPPDLALLLRGVDRSLSLVTGGPGLAL
ncbi:MAG: hypothetical protein ACOYMP_03975 [Nodosilinea sp.]